MNRRSVAPEIWRSAFRPFPLADSPFPFGVRSVGFYSVKAGWNDEPLRKGFCELFWCLSGRGVFKADGKDLELREGEAVALLPGETHLIRSLEPWSYHWITYDGALAEATLGKLAASFGRRLKAGPCPVKLFERVEAKLPLPDAGSQFQAVASGLEILCAAQGGDGEACEDGDEGDEATLKAATRAIEESYGDASFDVTRLAQRLGMHRTTLSRLFVRKLHAPPLKYLKALRLQKALALIKGSRLKVSEIAEACGFASPEYFTRAVRIATGMTPGRIRRGHGR